MKKIFTNIDSIKLDEFDLYINSPFVIFEKTNFLNEKLYNELRETFPKKELLTKIEGIGNKISLNNQSSTFNKFISENKSWGLFYNYLNSNEMILFFCDLIKSELDKIEQRKNLKPFFFVKDSNNKSLYAKIKKKVSSKFYTNLRLGFQFSILKNNSYIPPHTDTTNKLLSLMMYFPEENYPNIKTDEINNLGTNFYEKKKKDNYDYFDGWDSKLLSKTDTKIFHEKFKIFYRSKFQKNKLIGFIKNDKTWHEVTTFHFNQNFERRSININLYLD